MSKRTGLASLALALWCAAGLPETSYAVDPFENRANPPATYFSMYPSSYHASDIMDNSGKSTGVNPGLTSWQDSLRLTYYNRTTFSNTWAATVLLPTGRKEMFNDQSRGIGDITTGLSYWPVDVPDQNTWIGGGVYLDVPVGEYDSAKRANLGANVWKLRPTLLIARQSGGVSMDLSLKYNIYSKNKATSTKEGSEVIAESCFGYFVRPDILIGGLFNGVFGENRVKNGIELDATGLRRYQAGPTFFWRPYPGFGVTLNMLVDLEVENSVKGRLVISRLSWKL